MQIGTHHSLADLTNICSVQVEDVQWLHTALAQEIHSDLVHWCISSMHIQPELKHAWPRGCQTNHAGQARQTHFSATFAESEHLCVPRWQGVAGGGHTHTHTNRATLVSAETGGYHKTNWIIAMLHFLTWLKHGHINFLIALYLFGVILARLHLWLWMEICFKSIGEHFPARNLTNLNNMGAVSQQVQYGHTHTCLGVPLEL